MSDIYFSGDPEQDSARRHLERVLKGQQPRRWPLFAAILAGGTAFTLWRVRQRRQTQAAETQQGNRPAPAPVRGSASTEPSITPARPQLTRRR